MARMIPPRVHEGTPSSERRIFESLRTDPDTEDWVVLHSLGLARRGSLPYGEIDFVVLIPGAGVACLEVKGGGVRCDRGEWSTKDRFGRTHILRRSPFLQAREGVFGLRAAVGKRFGPSHDVSRMVFSAAVLFPDVTCPPATPEFERWEVIDREDLEGQVSGHLKNLILRDADRHQAKERLHLASGAALKELRNFLRPDFDVGVARTTSIRRSEERIVRLTEEQYDALDLFELNSRCLVEGAAGTGKTMLALEFAQRIGTKGQTVLLLCYNRLLGSWMSSVAETIGFHSPSMTGPFHRCLRRVILKGSKADEFLALERSSAGREADLFDLVYPYYGQTAVSELPRKADLLIVDEAQDLISPQNLEVLDAWVEGGLSEGRWVLLGDFSRQAIFSGESSGEEQRLLSRFSAQFTHAILRRNCRNTRKIGEETALLSGFDSLPYRLDSEDCLAVDYRYWKDPNHQRVRLEAVLEMLGTDGVHPGDIVVLSPRRFEHSVASRLTCASVTPIREENSKAPGIGFSTIQAFKGLESPVVVICDIEKLEEPRDRALLYVGMSRARSHLILLFDESLRGAVSEAVAHRLERGWSE